MRKISLSKFGGDRFKIEYTLRMSTDQASLWKHMMTDAVGKSVGYLSSLQL